MTNIENLENEPVYVNPEHLNMLAIVLQVFVFPLVCYFWFTNNFDIFNNLAYIATIFTIVVLTANLYFGTLNYNNTYLDLFKKRKNRFLAFNFVCALMPAISKISIFIFKYGNKHETPDQVQNTLLNHALFIDTIKIDILWFLLISPLLYILYNSGILDKNT